MAIAGEDGIEAVPAFHSPHGKPIAARRANVRVLNGPGVAPEVITRIVDFDRQTSSRAAYVGPNRGAQGNALQTVIATAYALTQRPAVTVLESLDV